MTNQTSKIRIKFRCDQDIDNMTIGPNGEHFCKMCQKSLVDFRLKSLKETINYTKEYSGCGIFKAEHVESDIFYSLSFASLRKYFLAFGTFLMAETGYSQTMCDSPQKTNTFNNDSKKEDLAKKHRYENKKRGFVILGPRNSIRRYDVDYGVFIGKRFPLLSFRRKIYRNHLTGFW